MRSPCSHPKVRVWLLLTMMSLWNARLVTEGSMLQGGACTYPVEARCWSTVLLQTLSPPVPSGQLRTDRTLVYLGGEPVRRHPISKPTHLQREIISLYRTSHHAHLNPFLTQVQRSACGLQCRTAQTSQLSPTCAPRRAPEPHPCRTRGARLRSRTVASPYTRVRHTLD